MVLKISRKKLHKAKGPDEIHGRVLKEYRTNIAPIFAIIFEKSLTSGSIPSDWKHANVRPVYKEGDKHESKKWCKDQESIQSSTTPDPGYQWESDKLTEDTTNESQEVSPFPAGDHKAHINRRAQNIAKLCCDHEMVIFL